MYNYIDSTGYVSTIYFPLIVIMGNFFLLKLFLAVIMSTFSELSHRNTEAEEKEIKMMLKKYGDDDIPTSQV